MRQARYTIAANWQHRSGKIDFRSQWAAGIARVLAVFAAWFFAVPTLAQPQQVATHIASTLELETAAPASGNTTAIAIKFAAKPGWHGYWLNPGDAGRTGVYSWHLPKGVTVGEWHYPVPRRLVVAGLMNHVYTGEFALIAKLRLAGDIAPGTSLPIVLDANWLACTDQICVPEHTTLKLELVAGTGMPDPQRTAMFDAWRAKLPQPLAAKASFAERSGKLRIAVPWPESQPVVGGWFYAATEQAVNYGGRQALVQQGDQLLLDLERDPYAREVPPHIDGVLALPDGRGFEISASPGTVPDVGQAGMSIWITLGGAILGGLLLNLMPCVFPVISLKAIALAKTAGNKGAARSEGLLYTAGAVAGCLLLGAILLLLRAGGHSVGWAFQLQSPPVIILLLLTFVLITLNFAGLFELKGLALTGHRGTFLTGALTAFVATPCTGPFMAAALGVALVVPTLQALVIFAGLGFGLALPFLLLGFVPALRKAVPRPGAWMVRLQRIMTLPSALTVCALAWLLWRQVGLAGLTVGLAAAGAIGVLAVARRKQPASLSVLALAAVAMSIGAAVLLPAKRPAPAAKHGNEIAFDAARLAQLRRERKPVFLYFTADWCLTCKVNEQAAIGRDETVAHFHRRRIVVMVGDWTRNDPAVTRFLESRGRSGVPLYLFYPANSADPVELPQILGPGDLTRL